MKRSNKGTKDKTVRGRRKEDDDQEVGDSLYLFPEATVTKGQTPGD